MAAERRLTPWTWGVGGVTFLAGFLFGYRPSSRSRGSTASDDAPLLFAGLVGMASLAAVGLSFAALDNNPDGQTSTVGGIVTVLALVVFIASFAFSMGEETA